MKQALFKIALVPIASYLLTLPTVAIIGTIDKSYIRETLDNSALSVWIAWVLVLFAAMILKMVYKKWQKT